MWKSLSNSKLKIADLLYGLVGIGILGLMVHMASTNVISHHSSTTEVRSIGAETADLDEGAFYDVSCSGEARDFCRYVGNPRFFSCALYRGGSSSARGTYRPSDFTLGEIRRHKDCLGKKSVQSTTPKVTKTSIVETQDKPPPAPVPFVQSSDSETTPWVRVSYNTRRFDHHEVGRGSEVECRKLTNGSIEIKGTIQCLTARTDCFNQKAGYKGDGNAAMSGPLKSALASTTQSLPECPIWGVTNDENSESAEMFTIPETCRPVSEQYYVLSSFAYPQIILIKPSGSVTVSLSSMLDSDKWYQNLEGIAHVKQDSSIVAKVTIPSWAETSPSDRDYIKTMIETPVVISSRPTVAIGVPMTSHGTKVSSVEGSPLYQLALPRLRELLPEDVTKFKVVVYAGYDAGDAFWTKANPKDVDDDKISIKFTECPCKSMVCNTNCIMKKAYEDGAEFYFRSNDDTSIKHGTNWISTFVADLASFTPPYFGVVGPLCKQGNTDILTHDFVHRRHLEIFKYDYYPSVLENYWCDDWISSIYGKDRTLRESKVEVIHHVNSVAKTARYRVSHGIKAPGGLYDQALIKARLRIRIALGKECDM